MKKFYSLYADSKILQCILNSTKINCNTMIAALILPAHATWCSESIPVSGRNLLHLDSDFIQRYCSTMHISEKIFKECITELKKCNIIHKAPGMKNCWYINPYWASIGKNNEVEEFRCFCADKNLFLPWSLRHADFTQKETQDKLAAEIRLTSKKYSRMCLDLSNAEKYLGFIGNGKDKFNTKDLALFIILASRCNVIKTPTPETSNIVHLSVNDQKKIGNQLQLTDRAIRDGLDKLTRRHLLHKLPSENGKYMVNPLLCVKGAEKEISALRAKIMNVSSRYFGSFPDGELKKETSVDRTIILNQETGEVIYEYPLIP